MYYAVKSLTSARFPFNLSVSILEKLAQALFLKKKKNHYILTAKTGDSGDALTVTPRRKFPQFVFIINDGFE